MPGVRDPARVARDRLLRQERQAKARAEAQAVAEGVAETVALSRARGAVIVDAPAAGRGAYRRLDGLAYLARKGRISAKALAAGHVYGEAFRGARREASIPSTLDERLGLGGSGGPTLPTVLARAARAEQARMQLMRLRARLCGQADLVAACDAICGEEKTPREAGGNDREALRIEALLKVALDLLARPDAVASS